MQQLSAFQKQFLGFLVINDKLLCAGALNILRYPVVIINLIVTKTGFSFLRKC